MDVTHLTQKEMQEREDDWMAAWKLRMEQLKQAEAENSILRTLLAGAADDLGKAANQFAGILPTGENQYIFAAKELALRTAMDRPMAEVGSPS